MLLSGVLVASWEKLGKSSMNSGFWENHGTKWGGFSLAMFDFRRVAFNLRKQTKRTDLHLIFLTEGTACQWHLGLSKGYTTGPRARRISSLIRCSILGVNLHVWQDSHHCVGYILLYHNGTPSIVSIFWTNPFCNPGTCLCSVLSLLQRCGRRHPREVESFCLCSPSWTFGK